MTTTPQDRELPWLDLSAYNTRLAVLDVPRPDGKPGARYLVLAPTSAEDTEAFDQIGKTLDFKKISKDGRELYILQGVTEVDLGPYLKTLRSEGFGDVKVTKVKSSDVFLSFAPSAPKKPAPAETPKPDTATVDDRPAEDESTADATAQDNPVDGQQGALWDDGADAPAAAPRAQRQRDPLKSSKYVLDNSKLLWDSKNDIQGRQVREFTDGKYAGQRFVYLSFGRSCDCILESRTTHKSSVMRVETPADVTRIAATVGDEMLHDGRVMRSRDIRDLADLMFGEGATDDQVEQLTRALTNHFTLTMRNADDQKFNALWDMSQRIAEASAYTAELAASENAIADINMPISVILHRIAAGLAQPDVKVTFTNPGNGALFSKWKKIGPESDLKIYDSRQEVVDDINELGRDFGLRRTERARLETPDYTGRDTIVANVETGWLPEPRAFGPFEFRRREFVDMLEALEQRNPDGNAIFSLPLDKDPAVEEELQQFLELLGRTYAVEGIAEIDSTVHAKVPGGRKLMLLSVSNRRPEPLEQAPEPSLRRRSIFDFATLSTWSAEVIKSRQKIADHLKALEGVETENDEERQRNLYQAPYISASKVSEAETMVPKHLEGPMRIAMARLLQFLEDKKVKDLEKGLPTVESIDEYVAQALGMTLEQLAKHYSSEQVDAIALDMYAEERGMKGFHIGDQTGVGKGREAAGIALRHINQGRMPIMTTKATGNITDIIRDLGDAGALDSCNPLILNSGTFEYVDKETGEVRRFEGISKKRFEQEFMVTEPVLDAEGNEVLDENGDPKVTRRVQLPEGSPYNMIITSYSQINGDLEKRKEEKPDHFGTWKHDLFDQILDKNCVLIMDEAQAATGKGNTGRTMRDAIRRTLRTTFMSATHAKDAATLRLYNILFPEYLDEDTIYELMIKGGETAQEVATAMLAENGVFVRREHDNSSQKFENVYDEENEARNRAIIDSISPILSEVAFLSGDINRRINRLILDQEAELEQAEAQLDEVQEQGGGRRNPAIRRAQAAVDQRRAAVKSLQSTRLGFGSPLFRIMKNVVSALKADCIAQQAIKDLQEGRKPIIMADSTMGELYKDLERQQNEAGLDAAPPPSLSDFVMREITNVFSAIEKHLADHPEAADIQPLPAPAQVAAQPPAADAEANNDLPPEEAQPAAAGGFEDVDFSNVGEVQRLATPDDVQNDHFPRLPAAPNEQAAPAAERRREDIDPILIQHYLRIKQMVRDLPHLNISLIDEVQRQIREAGFTVDEITGRSHAHNGRKFVRRAKRLSTDIVNDFNNGPTQALVVNKSGLTGLSMHDAPWFVNHGQRVMYEGDAPLDIDTQIQGYGRTGRKGAQSDQLIKLIISGIPAELRAHAARNMKLRRLSANVSSNRDSSALLDGIPDLFNSVGDAICAQYFEARPDLLAMLGFEENHAEHVAARNEDGEVSENKRTANQILARMALLPCALQEEVLADIQAEFEAKIIELDQANANPLKPAQLQGKVFVKEVTIFEGPQEELVIDAFEAPVKLVSAVIEVDELGFTGDDLDRKVEENASSGDGRFADRQGDRIFRERADRLEQILRSLHGAYPDVATAIAAGNNKVSQAADRFEKLEELCRNLVPGVKVKMTNRYDQEVEGIITGVNHPWTDGSILSANGYNLRIITAGDGLPHQYSIDSLMKDEAFIKRDEEGNFEGFNYSPGLLSNDDDEVDAILKEFDAKAAFKSQHPVELLVGNTFRAMQIVEEIKDKGSRVGILCAYEDAEDGLLKRGVYLKSKAAMAEFIPVPLRSAEMAYDFLREQPAGEEITIYPDPKRSRRAMAIKRCKDGTFEVNLPNPTNKDYGRIYENPVLADIYEEVAQNFEGGRKQVKMKVHDGQAVLDWLREVMADNKIRFWTDPNRRDWANEWSNRKAFADGQDAQMAADQDSANDAGPPQAPGMAMAG